jgi:hypothetical protein
VQKSVHSAFVITFFQLAFLPGFEQTATLCEEKARRLRAYTFAISDYSRAVMIPDADRGVMRAWESYRKRNTVKSTNTQQSRRTCVPKPRSLSQMSYA